MPMWLSRALSNLDFVIKYRIYSKRSEAYVSVLCEKVTIEPAWRCTTSSFNVAKTISLLPHSKGAYLHLGFPLVCSAERYPAR